MIVNFTKGYDLLAYMLYYFICGKNIDPLTIIYIKYQITLDLKLDINLTNFFLGIHYPCSIEFKTIMG